ncbi:hypothetical protein PZA11_003240 [Diplocarpon coronariae]|uniref:Signal peptidase I n=1 Tax=Diplocarpon coronariae TaxID=2795749 RepID=A0A218ZF90_9HELO|nr:signal peptidase I [Marssonina coronariae]
MRWRPTFPRVTRIFANINAHYTGHPLRVLSAAVKTIFFTHLYVQYGPFPSGTYGASMLPTLEVIGDFVLIDKRFRRGRGVLVGDVVCFDSVVETGGRVIKRVVGLGGDYVMLDTPETTDRMIQVPEGHCWVVGDNMPYSRDSRHYGPVPMALVRGKVIAKAFPWSERKWIGNGLQPVQ